MKAKSATKVSLIKSVKGEFRTRSSASPTSAPLLRKRSRRYSELDLDQKSMVRIYIYTYGKNKNETHLLQILALFV